MRDSFAPYLKFAGYDSYQLAFAAVVEPIPQRFSKDPSFTKTRMGLEEVKKCLKPIPHCGSADAFSHYLDSKAPGE